MVNDINNPQSNDKLKFCPDCDKELPILSFKLKGRLKEGGARYDKYCLTHRKERDREAKRAKKNISKQSPKRLKMPSLKLVTNNVVKERRGQKGLIEPQIKETNGKVLSIDFGEFENSYGEKLSSVEKSEIVENFNDYVNFLKQEYSKIMGKKVYVKN